MSESEIFVCRQCGKEHEALTQEIGSYQCPNRKKEKVFPKVLDSVSLKYLTEVNPLSETQDSKLRLQKGGELYGEKENK